MSAAKRSYADPRLGTSCRLLMRHDFKRAFYRAMQAGFAPEVVKDFFSRIPLVIGDKTFRLKELLAKVLLTWLYPKMESLFSSVDTRDARIRLITLFNE